MKRAFFRGWRCGLGLLGIGILAAPSLRADPLDQWTVVRPSPTNAYGLRCVAYGNGCFVAAGGWSDWGVVYSSPDGTNWTLRSNGGGFPGDGINASHLAYVEAITYGGGRFVTAGFWGGFGVSTNGTNWAITNVPTAGVDPVYLNGIAYGTNGVYVAVGHLQPTNVNCAFTSTDAINWTAQNSGQVNLTDVAYGAGLFVAVNESPKRAIRSVNGASWLAIAIPGGSKVSFCKDLFIIPYDGGTNLLSRNGVTWQSVPTGISALLGKVSYASGMFLARAGNNLATSTDGTNWVQYPQTLPGTSSIASDGVRLVTVGDNFAPFQNFGIGYTYASAPLVGLQIISSPPAKLALSGLVGRSYRIESTEELNSHSNHWQTLANVQLPSTPYLITDSTATNSQRFYRAVLLP